MNVKRVLVGDIPCNNRSEVPGMGSMRVVSPRDDLPCFMRGRGAVGEQNVTFAVTGTNVRLDMSDSDACDSMHPHNADLENENAGSAQDKARGSLVAKGFLSKRVVGAVSSIRVACWSTAEATTGIASGRRDGRGGAAAIMMHILVGLSRVLKD